jgi:hypothetical protein
MPRYQLRGSKRRNAAILFVCVVLLTLFLVIGLCFVLFADAQATSSRFYREAHLNLDEYPSPEMLFGWGLGSLIYPNDDEFRDDTTRFPNWTGPMGAGPLCAARGHELSRNMYGWNYQLNNQANPTDLVGLNNFTPYNGIGRPVTGAPTTSQPQNPWGVDDRKLINYVDYNYYPSNSGLSNSNNNNLINRGVGFDYFKRNPERVGVTPNGPATFAAGNFAGGFNAPYTMADLNNVYLADVGMAQNPIDPTSWFLYANKRSFWRGDEAGFRHPTMPGGMNSLDPQNPAWTDPSYPGGPYTAVPGGYDARLFRYLTLRPRPADQLMPSEIQQLSGMTAAQAEQQIRLWATPGSPDQRLFPLPAPQTPGTPWTSVDFGDVRNLPGAGPNDAIWMDLSFGTFVLQASQKKVKPMFAVTIVDLDGRVNMNVAGNVTESSQVGFGFHGSNQGFGPHEINPRWLMGQTPNPLGGPPFPAGGDQQPDSNGPVYRNEYLNLFRGVVSNAGSFAGRYGLKPDAAWDPRYYYPNINPTYNTNPNLVFPYPNGQGAGGRASPTNGPLYYARADYDGSSVRSPSPPPGVPPASYGFPAQWIMPNQPTNQFGSFVAMPYFPGWTTSNPNNPGPYCDGNDEERSFHPGLFSPFLLNHPAPNPGAPPAPQWPQQTVYPIQPNELDRLFPVGDMRGLIAWTTPPGPTGPLPLPPYAISDDTLNTEFAKVWPNHIKAYPKLRNLITTLSMDRDSAGAFPGQGQTPYLLDGSQPPGANRVPQGTATYISSGNPQSLFPQMAAGANVGGDMRPPVGGPNPYTDYRSLLADLGRVNLNRSLTPYPLPALTQSNFLDSGVVTWDTIQAWRADRDRVMLARDIFARLRLATGAADPTQFLASDPGQLLPTDPNRQQFEALRYLAQLAANIVDFIDTDDIATTFNFLSDQISNEPVFGAGQMPAPMPTVAWGWVVGTELPRIVINEAYGQLQNAPEDAGENFNIAPNGKYVPGADFDPDTPPGQDQRPFMNITAADKPKVHATKPYRMNFFVELHNPHVADPARLDREQWSARLMLQNDPNPGVSNIYKVLIRSEVNSQQTRGVENVLGQPMPAPNMLFQPLVNLEVVDFRNDGSQPTPQQFYSVNPATAIASQNWTNKDPMYGDQTNNSGINNGYLLLGPGKTGTGSQTSSGWQAEIPRDRAALANPTMYPTISVQDFNGIPGVLSRMYADIDNATPIANVTGPNAPVGVFLQRLAKPNMAPRDRPPAPGVDPRSFGNYNPYVTVDYVENIPVMDGVLCDTMGLRDGTGMNGGQGLRASLAARASFGRKQPFKATGAVAQQPQPQNDSIIHQTFFRQNGQPANEAPGAANPGGTLDPFSWLVHYDRVPTSAMDLLHVSAFKPHELTQEFMNGGNPANHQIPWRVPQTRLFRGLELLSAGSFMNGAPFGGRLPGKININTMADKEVFQALCDALQPNPASPTAQRHYFNTTTIDNAWNVLQQMRQNSIPIFSPGQPWGNNQDNQFPPPPNPPGFAGNGPERSMLMKNPATGQPLFTTSAADNHPYNLEELLRKIAGNVTTRSNVFAVYITTAYFEVRKPQGPGDPDGDQFQPPLLGREVDARLRHHMFAVVDRTNLSLDVQNTYGQPQLPAPNNGRMQGARPIYFPLRPFVINPNIPQPSATNNFTDLRDLNVIPNIPNDVTYLTYVPAAGVQMGPNGPQLVVRDTIDHNGREYSDGPDYSGETAVIFPGMHLFLDTGTPGQMEEVVVAAQDFVYNPADPSRSYIRFGRLDGNAVSKHARGAAICTVLPGNPGPQQLPIPYDDPPYSNTVVPYRVILQ